MCWPFPFFLRQLIKGDLSILGVGEVCEALQSSSMGPMNKNLKSFKINVSILHEFWTNFTLIEDSIIIKFIMHISRGISFQIIYISNIWDTYGTYKISFESKLASEDRSEMSIYKL